MNQHSTVMNQLIDTLKSESDKIIAEKDKVIADKDELITDKNTIIIFLLNTFVQYINHDSLINWYKFASSHGPVSSVRSSTLIRMHVNAKLTRDNKEVPVQFNLYINDNQVYHEWVSGDFTMRFEFSNIASQDSINYSKVLEIFLERLDKHIAIKNNPTTYDIGGCTVRVVD